LAGSPAQFTRWLAQAGSNRSRRSQLIHDVDIHDVDIHDVDIPDVDIDDVDIVILMTLMSVMMIETSSSMGNST
jgi:hypothetical protein